MKHKAQQPQELDHQIIQLHSLDIKNQLKMLRQIAKPQQQDKRKVKEGWK